MPGRGAVIGCPFGAFPFMGIPGFGIGWPGFIPGGITTGASAGSSSSTIGCGVGRAGWLNVGGAAEAETAGGRLVGMIRMRSYWDVPGVAAARCCCSDPPP